METTMQDSKRLIENQYLRDISKLVVQGKSWGQDCIINPEDQESLVLRELVDFIGSEISKAREEGKMEVLEEMIKENGGNIIPSPEAIPTLMFRREIREYLNNKLSKLKTKEDGK